MRSLTDKKNILICLAGITPQIVTEAFYCLSVRKKIRIDEICVISTDDTKQNLIECTLPNMTKLCKDYNIEIPQYDTSSVVSAAEEAGYITNPDGISKYTTTDLIFDILSEKTSDNTTIHFFLTGGRKTMSSDGLLAMSLFGRNHDKLYHIITNPDYYPDSHYYPMNATEDKNLFLIEKPFIRLRNKLSFIENLAKGSFAELIERTQNEIDNMVALPELIIYRNKREVQIGSKSVILQPLVFSVYLFFARQKNPITGGKNFSRSNSENLWKIYRKVSTSAGQTDRVVKNSYHNDIFDFDVIQKAISTIRSSIFSILGGNPLAEYYIVSVEGNYADKKYGIKLQKNRIKII